MCLVWLFAKINATEKELPSRPPKQNFAHHNQKFHPPPKKSFANKNKGFANKRKSLLINNVYVQKCFLL